MLLAEYFWSLGVSYFIAQRHLHCQRKVITNRSFYCPAFFIESHNLSMVLHVLPRKNIMSDNQTSSNVIDTFEILFQVHVVVDRSKVSKSENLSKSQLLEFTYTHTLKRLLKII